jgi:23S rRNA pseudouridine1911/1915/1917 synthase
MQKIYLALVAGILRKPSGVIDLAIARHPVHRQRMSIARRQGRAAKTEYRVLRAGAGLSLLECTLHSGRTHQIRVHLHHLAHPVVGDKVYGGKHASAFPRQMLHAWKLAFHHPRTGERTMFDAPVPPDFADAMRQIPENA